MTALIYTNWSEVEIQAYTKDLKYDTHVVQPQPLLNFDQYDIIIMGGHITAEFIDYIPIDSPPIWLFSDINTISNLLPKPQFDRINDVVVCGFTDTHQLLPLIKHIGSTHVHGLNFFPINKPSDSGQIGVWLNSTRDKNVIFNITTNIRSWRQKYNNDIILFRMHPDGSDQDEMTLYTFIAQNVSGVCIFTPADLADYLEGITKLKYGFSQTDLGAVSSLGLTRWNIIEDVILSPINMTVSDTLAIQKIRILMDKDINRPQRRNVRKYISTDQIYDKITKYISEQFDGPPIWTMETATRVAKMICYTCTGMVGSKYEWGAMTRLMSEPDRLYDIIQCVNDVYQRDNFKMSGCIQMKALIQDNFKGLHRAGWNYVMQNMECLQSEYGVITDTYLDRSFVWGTEVLVQDGVLPYTAPWIGFVHHTFETQFSQNNCEVLCENPYFRSSLIHCTTLICLTEYLAQQFKIRFPHLNIIVLYHPTEFPVKLWNEISFAQSSIQLVNVGAWYRNPFSIFRLTPVSGVSKLALKGPQMDSYFPPKDIIVTTQTLQTRTLSNKWMQYMALYARKLGYNSGNYVVNGPNMDQQPLSKQLRNMLSSVKILEALPNDEYDKLLCSSVVFLDLVDASACNTVIECIVRNTPVLVNAHPAVVEYIGADYPLLYQDIEQAHVLLTRDKILSAHRYLKQMDKSWLRIDTFMNKFNSIPVLKLHNSIQRPW
jgi:hypothetical protein